jgi:hypothetical protein
MVAAARLKSAKKMEASDSAIFRAYVSPTSTCGVRTVCVIARRAENPSSVGSLHDRDAESCKLFAPFSMQIWAPTFPELTDTDHALIDNAIAAVGRAIAEHERRTVKLPPLE